MATQAELQAELTELQARRKAIAGIDSQQFSDQATRFDHSSLDRRIAVIQSELAALEGTTRTRYAQVIKGV